MTPVSALRLTLASLALFSSLATAQTRFCLGGNLQLLSEAEKSSCKSQLQSLRQSVGALPQSEDWHIVLVCGDRGWEEYQSFLGATDARLTAAKYDINLDRHEIFLRSNASVDAIDSAQMSKLLREVTLPRKMRPTLTVGE